MSPTPRRPSPPVHRAPISAAAGRGVARGGAAAPRPAAGAAPAGPRGGGWGGGGGGGGGEGGGGGGGGGGVSRGTGEVSPEARRLMAEWGAPPGRPPRITEARSARRSGAGSGRTLAGVGGSSSS